MAKNYELVKKIAVLRGREGGNTKEINIVRWKDGVPLKQIQEWLGHSDFSTTANIYAHLDYTLKLSSAQSMVDGIALPQADHFGSRWDRIAENG